MLKILLSSLFKRKSTLMYPIKNREFSAISRGTIHIEIEKCIFCGICQRKCPSGALKVFRAEKKWEINRYSCVQCNCCVENCPKKCLYMNNSRPVPTIKMTTEVFEDARVSDNSADNKNS